MTNVREPCPPVGSPVGVSADPRARAAGREWIADDRRRGVEVRYPFATAMPVPPPRRSGWTSARPSRSLSRKPPRRRGLAAIADRDEDVAVRRDSHVARGAEAVGEDGGAEALWEVIPTRSVAQATLAPPAGVVVAPTPMVVDVVGEDDVLAQPPLQTCAEYGGGSNDSLMVVLRPSMKVKQRQR